MRIFDPHIHMTSRATGDYENRYRVGVRALEVLDVHSAADWGRSDPLKTHHVGVAMLEAGFSESDVDTVLWRNPVEFYGQSGRLVLDELPGFTASTDVFAGNSVLRGGGND
jgi:predicted metal-dependent TIM-barrel fold hydrolase